MEIERKQQLEEALANIGLEFRDDSELCKKYISGEETRLNFVVDTMNEMEFYFTKTMYRNIYKREKYEAKRLDKNWNDDKEEIIRNRAKEKAYKNYIYKYRKSNDMLEKIPQTIKKKFEVN